MPWQASMFKPLPPTPLPRPSPFPMAAPNLPLPLPIAATAGVNTISAPTLLLDRIPLLYQLPPILKPRFPYPFTFYPRALPPRPPPLRLRRCASPLQYQQRLVMGSVAALGPMAAIPVSSALSPTCATIPGDASTTTAKIRNQCQRISVSFKKCKWFVVVELRTCESVMTIH